MTNSKKAATVDELYAQDRAVSAKELAESFTPDKAEQSLVEKQLRAMPREWSVRLDGVLQPGSVTATSLHDAMTTTLASLNLKQCDVFDLAQKLEIKCRDESGSFYVEADTK